MTSGNLVDVVTDGRIIAFSRTSTLRMPMSNENGLCKDGDEFQFHKIWNPSLLIHWRVNILMWTVSNPQIRRLSCSSNNEESGYRAIRMVEGIVLSQAR